MTGDGRAWAGAAAAKKPVNKLTAATARMERLRARISITRSCGICPAPTVTPQHPSRNAAYPVFKDAGAVTGQARYACATKAAQHKHRRMRASDWNAKRRRQ